MAVTSSVPRVTTALRQMAKRWFEVPCVVLEPGVRSGMPILYDNPKEVGPDRIANAIGAYDLYGGPCVVVDLGTATTFDAISGSGEYLGGAIAPGIAISMDALFHHAAALRARRARRAAQRHRQVHRRVDPVGRALRLRRAGRRHVPAHRRRARPCHGGRPPAGSRRSSRRCRSASSTASRGSRCTDCASSTSATPSRRERCRRGDGDDPVASRPVAEVPYSFDRTAEAGPLHDRYRLARAGRGDRRRRLGGGTGHARASPGAPGLRHACATRRVRSSCSRWRG